MEMPSVKLSTHRGVINIIEFGNWIPEKVLESSHLQNGIHTLPKLNGYDIFKRAGVVQRRIAPEHMTVIDMGELAARDAIEKAQLQNNIALEDVDTIIYCGVSRMYAEPSTATLIQKRLGIHSAMSFDVSNACLGFLDGLIIADSFIASGRSKLALIISAEKFDSVRKKSYEAIIERENGIECLPALTLGDGAIAMLVCADSYKSTIRLQLAAFSRTTLSHYAECCILPSMKHALYTDSKAMFEGALAHYPKMCKDLLADLNWDLNDVDFIIPHQASVKIIERGMELIGYPIEKCAITIDEYGNMASVSVPFSLQKILNEQQLPLGSKIIILGFGSGLSFSMMAFEVCEDATKPEKAIA